MRLRWEDKHHLKEICRSKSTNQFGERSKRLPDLCFSICRFFQMVFVLRAQPHAQSLFLFPIVFGIILIHFFDGKNNRVTWESRNKEGEIFWQQKVSAHCEFQRHNGDHLRRERWEVWREKRKVRIFGKGKCKLIANFSTTMVTSLPSLSLSLSLSLSVSLSLSLSLSFTSRTSRS